MNPFTLSLQQFLFWAYTLISNCYLTQIIFNNLNLILIVQDGIEQVHYLQIISAIEFGSVKIQL
jgi:hypothetical protein